MKMTIKRGVRRIFRSFPALGTAVGKLNALAAEEKRSRRTETAEPECLVPDPEEAARAAAEAQKKTQEEALRAAQAAAEAEKAAQKAREDAMFGSKVTWTGYWTDYFGSLLLPKEVREAELKRIFYRHCGYYLDMDEPKTFNQKIQWLKLNYFDPRMARCVDKCEFKRYIAEQLGEGYTVPMYREWDSENQIDFDSLPERFVLKSNVQSNGRHILVVPDKKELNIDRAKTVMSGWLQKRNNLCSSYCGAYHYVTPKILAEEFIGQMDASLTDYKFFCFGGKAEMVMAVSDRKDDMRINFYDLSWNLLPFREVNFRNSDEPLPMPENLNKMISIANKLAEPFPFVRVDFYELPDSGKLYVGELTFYPAGGYEPFEPMDWDFWLGEKLLLPEANI